MRSSFANFGQAVSTWPKAATCGSFRAPSAVLWGAAGGPSSPSHAHLPSMSGGAGVREPRGPRPRSESQARSGPGDFQLIQEAERR